jgi:hypothetical protein
VKKGSDAAGSAWLRRWEDILQNGLKRTGSRRGLIGRTTELPLSLRLSVRTMLRVYVPARITGQGARASAHTRSEGAVQMLQKYNLDGNRGAMPNRFFEDCCLHHLRD